MSQNDPEDDGGEGKTVRRAVLSGPRIVSEPVIDATSVRQVHSDADPLIGAMLGEYRVLAPLGSGGMGVVYRGEQPVIGRPVAIKVLKRQFAQDPVHMRRFLEEARSVSAARHPGIIDVFSFGETLAGEPYLVMELLEGEPLDAMLRRREALPAKEAVQLLIPMLNALSAAHAAGVTHRDLKPANVFIVTLKDGTTFPKLLDFGLARRGEAGSRVRQTSVGGTPLYIAPEQARGEEVGPQTDLYSFGCVAYELLGGAPPFTAVNLHELLDQHATLAPEPLRPRVAGVSAELEQLVLQMLEKDPSNRPASALEVRERLEKLQQARPPRKARPAQVALTSISLPAQDRGRVWWPWALGGLALLALVVGIALALRPIPVEPVAVAPPPLHPIVVAPPVAPQPEPEATPVEAPDPEPVNTPPRIPKPTPKHTARDLQKRWQALRIRSKSLPDNLKRAATLDLDEAQFCTTPVERCWRELNEVEALYFSK